MSYECTINLLAALDWQRSKAEKLKALIQKKQEWYEKNHCEFWNSWVDDVFNLDTANDFGLSVWSIILDEPITGVTEPSPLDYPSFGFNSDDDENFNNGSFGSDQAEEFNFTTEQKRTLLKLKAYILHMSGSVPDINDALARLFGAGQIVALDNLNMGLVYLISSEELIGFIREIRSRDLLPRPAAVSVETVLDDNTDAWGFGDFFENFDNGNFYDGQL